MSELGPLPDDLRDFLDAERDVEDPGHATRERMSSRLAPFLLPTGGGHGSETTGGPAAAGTSALAKAAWRGKVILSLVSAAIGAGAGATMHAVLTSPGSQAAVVAPLQTSPSAPVPVPEAPSESAPVETAPAASANGSPTASASAHAEPKGKLLAERLLIESATEAITRGDSASAIAALQKHAREFPKGQLVEEREALMIQALRAAGDESAAQQRAKDFKRKFPGSLQQGTVDKASKPR